MKLIILFGPPGVGKGTQCALLSSRLGFVHVSTGSLIRKEIQSRSELGVRVQQIVESGNLVDDDTIMLCLERAFENIMDRDATILLDGLPRNLEQAHRLQKVIARFAFESVQFVCLEAQVEKLVERFERRLTCSVCHHIESIPVEQQADGDFLGHAQCPACRSVGSFVRRKDDAPETVRHRLCVYDTETRPLVAFYRERISVHCIDGLMPPEIVYVKVASCLI